MKQAESKPLKVLIRVKKDQVGNLLCYIVGVVTMPQRRLENKFGKRRPQQSPFLCDFDLIYYSLILRVFLTENVVI